MGKPQTEQEIYNEDKKSKKKGFMSTQETVHVAPLKTDPSLLHCTKAEFKKKRELQKKASAAAKEASDKVLREHGVSEEEAGKNAEVEKLEKDIAKTKSEIAKLHDKIAANPKDKKSVEKVSDLTAKLDDLEASLQELEEQTN